MPQIGIGRLDELLRSFLGIKSVGTVTPELASDLFPVYNIGAPPWELADTAILAGWRGFQANDYEGPVAGQYSYLQLQNPVGSGVLCVVRSIWTQANAAAGAYALFADTIPGTLFGGAAIATRVRLDTRGVDPLTLTGAAVVTTGSGVGAPPYQSRVFIQPTTGGTDTEVLYVISPGYGLELKSGALNTEVRVGLSWWERRATPGELAAM